MPAYDPRGGGNVHIDVVLSNISVARLQESLNVASRLAPAVRVNKQSDKYYVHGRESWRAPNFGGDVRAPAGRANEIPGLRVSTDTYYAYEHALQGTVTPEERENADRPLNPDRDMTDLVTSQIVLGRELAFRDLVTDPTNYAAENVITLSGMDQFSDHENSDPISVFREVIRRFHSKMYVVPNTVVVPWLTMFWLEDHPQFRTRVEGVETQWPSRDRVRQALGVQNLIVPGAGMNEQNNPGLDEELGYVWTNDIVFAWVPPRPGIRVPAFMYEFVWPIQGLEQATDRWFDIERVADVIRVRRRYDFKFIGKNDDVQNDSPGDEAIAGFLIKDAIDPDATISV